jgi:hypothetical protein
LAAGAAEGEVDVGFGDLPAGGGDFDGFDGVVGEVDVDGAVGVLSDTVGDEGAGGPAGGAGSEDVEELAEGGRVRRRAMAAEEAGDEPVGHDGFVEREGLERVWTDGEGEEWLAFGGQEGGFFGGVAEEGVELGLVGHKLFPSMGSYSGPMVAWGSRGWRGRVSVSG